MERSQPGLQRLSIVVLPPDEWLASHIILARDLWRRKLFMVGAAASWVYQSASHALHLRRNCIDLTKCLR